MTRDRQANLQSAYAALITVALGIVLYGRFGQHLERKVDALGDAALIVMLTDAPDRRALAVR